MHFATGSSMGTENDTWVSARIKIFTILLPFETRHHRVYYANTNYYCVVLLAGVFFVHDGQDTFRWTPYYWTTVGRITDKGEKLNNKEKTENTTQRWWDQTLGS